MPVFLTHTPKLPTNPPQPNARASRDWFRMKHEEEERRATVYIYDEISFWGITAQDIAEEITSLDVDHIDLHINSPGGWVFDGVAIYNLFQQHKATVDVYVDGIAASIASVIAMAGDNVFIAENAMLMIHKPYVLMVGDADELRKEADVLDQIEKVIINTYRSRVDMPEDEMAALLADETWIDAGTAVELGFATSTVANRREAASVVSRIDFSAFANAPQRWSLREPLSEPDEATTPPRALLERQVALLQRR